MRPTKGLTLIEVILVIAIAAILATITIPTISALQNATSNRCSPITINTLLSSARAIALKEQKYVGVRFQQKDNVQYAIYIIHCSRIPYPDDPNDRTVPFIAAEGHQPLNLGRGKIASDGNDQVTIVFSPQGQLWRIWVKIYSNPEVSTDEIFGNSGLFQEDKNSYLSSRTLFINSQKYFVNHYIGNLIQL